MVKQRADQPIFHSPCPHLAACISKIFLSKLKKKRILLWALDFGCQKNTREQYHTFHFFFLSLNHQDSSRIAASQKKKHFGQGKFTMHSYSKSSLALHFKKDNHISIPYLYYMTQQTSCIMSFLSSWTQLTPYLPHFSGMALGAASKTAHNSYDELPTAR